MKSAWMLIIGLFFSTNVMAHTAVAKDMTYFSCQVKEKIKTREVVVTVKFAVSNLDIYRKKGSLEIYPNMTEEQKEMGAIFVSPSTVGKSITMMTNLNGQGGDLRMDSATESLRLFGDGDGYQFTDLVIWDVEAEDGNKLEGYVRDYGPTYGDSETFKQFIKCKRSKSIL